MTFLRQTDAQAMLEVWRAFYKGHKEVPAREFKPTVDRVGTNDTARLEWAVNFCQEPFEEMNEGLRFNAALELGIFLNPFLGQWVENGELDRVPLVRALFPTPEQIPKFQEDFL